MNDEEVQAIIGHADKLEAKVLEEIETKIPSDVSWQVLGITCSRLMAKAVVECKITVEQAVISLVSQYHSLIQDKAGAGNELS